MCSTIAVILIACLAQAHAGELLANHATNTQESVDESVDEAVDALYSRALDGGHPHAGLEETTLGKAQTAGQVAFGRTPSVAVVPQPRVQSAPGLTRLPRDFIPVRMFPVAMATAMASGSERKFFVGGNWKANGSPDSVKTLVEELNAGKMAVDTSKDVEVVCAPPFVYLSQVKNSLRPDFSVAAQNMWDKAPGAWTGEIPAEMLVSMGIGWVIVGHSERREFCGETNQVVADKTKFAIDNGLNSITCIGEKLDAREAGTTFAVLDQQMKPLAATLTEADWDKVVLAYEPVWAIGTGKVATPDQAEETHAYLRQWLKDQVSEKVSNSLRILYGGSVNDKNSEELGMKPNIDGFLVGGASLKGDAFTAIVNSAKASAKASA